MLATYSASKAFLATWTQALGKEVESKGITVQLLNTYFVVRSDPLFRYVEIVSID